MTDLASGDGRVPVSRTAADGLFAAGTARVRAVTPRRTHRPIVRILSENDPGAPHDIVDRASTSEYGPATFATAFVRTRDLSTPHRTTAGDRAGAVLTDMIHVPDAATSGHDRGMGPYAIVAYAEVKGVWTHLGGS
ncbi:hypothetical protein [Streptosporangium jomthongense]|uniref:Aldehyde oxidase/xanthine dehydrogenase a/b hammerhead domain-containing protein n=1 Tax=Streptosporangium jomthongense TaxID=1193683 RepID=A0ABV8EYD6_9ACTN